MLCCRRWINGSASRRRGRRGRFRVALDVRRGLPRGHQRRVVSQQMRHDRVELAHQCDCAASGICQAGGASGLLRQTAGLSLRRLFERGDEVSHRLVEGRGDAAIDERRLDGRHAFEDRTRRCEQRLVARGEKGVRERGQGEGQGGMALR
jgi:hypothetical protein